MSDFENLHLNARFQYMYSAYMSKNLRPLRKMLLFGVLFTQQCSFQMILFTTSGSLEYSHEFQSFLVFAVSCVFQSSWHALHKFMQKPMILF